MNIMRGIDRFWSRFRSAPEFAGKRILEVGCGKGALCIDMARAGAKKVVGVDILPRQIDAAKARVESEHPELAERIEFTTSTVPELDSRPFDLIVSKDAFEHIIDVPSTLAAIRERLAPSGTVFIGFSPLYHSPYGDHDRRITAFRDWGAGGRLLAMLPWGHVVLERQIIKRHSIMKSRPIKSMHDLNLNTMSIGDFRQYLQDAALEPQYFAVNRGGSPLGWPLSVLRKIPGLEKYCTYNVYCELTAASADSAAH